ncbi:mycofactocin biosynthesis glycosyltransferase MftF [Patulibacter sp. SYSU D01012]|uniref:mycofactocin biosynthesis glycosyltransferase MftF n=1 Tax=Patulibacter sp. SYSU D01012 TaxID=2817381 RepID=UPI001B300AD4|nr:mycofactocin biosynthesis glycosyltransferase MftF [Patulibacter sp. SYSU D01012]
MSSGRDVPLPEGFGLVLDASARVRDGGRTVEGGHPRRVLRLTSAGAAAVRALCAGVGAGDGGTRAGERSARGGEAAAADGDPEGGAASPLGASPAARALARRLVDAGVAHPVPPAARPRDVADVTVVIPVRDRPDELARCLRALGGHPHVTVVDDGSRDAPAVARVAAAHGARLVRREASGGPGVARNHALRAGVATSLVAFLDSDCVVPPGWLDGLVGHFRDPVVGGVAPRVRGQRDGDATIERWAAARSPLDLGPRPARVAPGTRVSYVPTAALVVRRSALGDGFDEALRYGEDVNLVWRLHDAGWALRYEPSVVVDHREPARWAAFLGRRFRYGSSAGPLARRHPGRLAPVVLSPWPTVTAALLVARRPRAAAAVGLVDGVRTARRLRPLGLSGAAAAGAVARTTLQTLDGLARAGTMLAPAPLLAVATARSRLRAPLLALTLGAPLAAWGRARAAGRTAGLGPVRWTAASLADDAAYGAGVWAGAVRARAPQALLPALGRPAGRTAPASPALGGAPKPPAGGAA